MCKCLLIKNRKKSATKNNVKIPTKLNYNKTKEKRGKAKKQIIEGKKESKTFHRMFVQLKWNVFNLSNELWVAPDEKSGKLRYACASKLLASNAAFKLADAVLIFVYPLPVKSECRANSTDGDAGGDGESNEITESADYYYCFSSHE